MTKTFDNEKNPPRIASIETLPPLPTHDNVLDIKIHKPLLESHDESKPLLPKPAVTATENSESSHMYGYLLMVCSSFGIGGMSFFVHIAENKFAFDPISAIFVRALVQAFVSGLVIGLSESVRKNWSVITRRQKQLIALRGILGGTAMTLYYVALGILPVGIAVTIFFLSPVFVMIFSRIFLKEPIYLTDCIAAGVSFTGLTFVARPDAALSVLDISKEDQIRGFVCAFLGAICSALAYVTQRGVGKSAHFMYSVCSLGIACIFISVFLGGAVGPGVFFTQTNAMIAMMFSSAFAFAGQCFLNKSLQHCPAGPGILIRNLDIPIVYFAGLLFLGESESNVALFGTGLIISGTVMIGLRPLLRNRS